MQPAPISRAIVFYGRVGTRIESAHKLPTGAPADALMWREAAEKADEFVVQPWRRSGRVDVFIQSWNAELSRSMDAFWKPMGSEHATQNNTLRCPIDGLRLCERTMWALLGMKRGLALRADAEARGIVPMHSTVMVARHDVYWRRLLPPLRADESVRLWLPFDCQLAYCRGGPTSEASSCAGNRIARNVTRPPSDWITLTHSKSRYFGIGCDATAGQLAPICASTVLIDWWFVGDRAIANGFGKIFDEFEMYSRRVRTELQLAISAPHQYWGLHFFSTLGLRRACQVGHVGMHALDFTLARFVPAGVDARSGCSWDAWKPYWHPPRTDCNASAIPGYLTACPGVPTSPLPYVCRSSEERQDSSELSVEN